MLVGIPRNCMRTAEPAVTFIQKYGCCSFMGWESWQNWGTESQRLWSEVHSEEGEKIQVSQLPEHYYVPQTSKMRIQKSHYWAYVSRNNEVKVPSNFPSVLKAKSPCFHLLGLGLQPEGMCTNSRKRVCIPACSWSTCWSSWAVFLHLSMNAHSCVGRNFQRASYARS